MHMYVRRCMSLIPVQMLMFPSDFRVYEKMMERMQEIGSTITGLKKTLAQWAKKKAFQGNQNIQKKYVYAVECSMSSTSFYIATTCSTFDVISFVLCQVTTYTQTCTCSYAAPVALLVELWSVRVQMPSQGSSLFCYMDVYLPLSWTASVLPCKCMSVRHVWVGRYTYWPFW